MHDVPSLTCQSSSQFLPEDALLVIFLRPLQVGILAHEFVQLAEPARDALSGDRFQEHQNHKVIVLVKEAVLGELQLILAPLAAHKMLANDKEGLSAFLDGLNYVVHDPLPWQEVPLVEAKLEGLICILQLGNQEVINPLGITLTIGNEGIKFSI